MSGALAFYKASGTIIDKAIRLRTGSPYSHVEYLPYGGAPDDEAAAWSSSARDGGVRCKLIHFRDDRWDIVRVPWAPKDAHNRIAREAGKKYDYLGVLIGRAFGVPVHQQSRWFCFEICGYALGLSEPHKMTAPRLISAMHQAAYR